MQKSEKYNKKVQKSKYECPTHIRMRSLSKGDLVIGHTTAKAELERERGHSLSHWIPRHSRNQWRWFKPIGVPVAG